MNMYVCMRYSVAIFMCIAVISKLVEEQEEHPKVATLLESVKACASRHTVFLLIWYKLVQNTFSLCDSTNLKTSVIISY